MGNSKWKMFRPLSPPGEAGARGSGNAPAITPTPQTFRHRASGIHIFHFPFSIFHLSLLLAILPSCAKVAVEGGDKPIHIVMDVNIRVDRELEQFFAFEEQYQAAATRPAGQAATLPTSTPVDGDQPSAELKREIQP